MTGQPNNKTGSKQSTLSAALSLVTKPPFFFLSAVVGLKAAFEPYFVHAREAVWIWHKPSRHNRSIGLQRLAAAPLHVTATCLCGVSLRINCWPVFFFFYFLFFKLLFWRWRFRGPTPDSECLSRSPNLSTSNTVRLKLTLVRSLNVKLEKLCTVFICTATFVSWGGEMFWWSWDASLKQQTFLWATWEQQNRISTVTLMDDHFLKKNICLTHSTDLGQNLHSSHVSGHLMDDGLILTILFSQLAVS